MSMKDSYTDFHIDFGGTSVWYHVFEGRYLQLAENGTVRYGTATCDARRKRNEQEVLHKPSSDVNFWLKFITFA